MERKVYLQRYRLYLDHAGAPSVIRRSASEATFRGEDLRSGKDVAVQVVPMTALRTIAREELETEAKAARELKHTNIPRLRDFGFDDGNIIYVTEYFHGPTAAEWVASKGPMPVGVVLRIALQVLSASSAATFHGLDQHAINPDNVVLVPGQANEGEWPLIKLLNVIGVAPNTMPSRAPASADPVNFVSPEQLQTEASGFASRIYSLGATLWFLLTGAAPVDGAAAVENVARVPSVVRNLLAKMLATNPEERPLDPLALEAHIEDSLAQLDHHDLAASPLAIPPVSERVAPEITPGRVTLWRPIALAAVLFAIATISAVLLAGRVRSRATIGVPIGVPEASPLPSAQADVAAADEPSVVISTADASSEKQSVPTANGEGKESADQPAQVTNAAPEISPNESFGKQPAFAATEISPSPAAATERMEQVAVAQTEPTEEPSSSPEPTAAQVTLAVSKPIEPATPIPTPAKKVRLPKTAVESTPMPQPRGIEPTQFLGVSPDGNLVYGNSSGKTLSAPPVSREEAARKKSTPRPARETIDGLPVRAALPPDQ